MFWTGMLIFAVLAILPLTAAIILNTRDGSRLSQPEQESSHIDSEI